jgi:ATP-dependent RNA helicase RhlE
VQVAAVASTPELVDQSIYKVSKRQKPALLAHILATVKSDRVLVFTRTKHGADRVTKDLNHAGIRTDAIHGNKRQNVRQRTLEDFRTGRTRVLVATDIAARGIDVDGISHVINFDLPNEPESYVHRIGRTARAGASGQAISFCDPSGDERDYLRDIERLIRMTIKVRDDAPADLAEVAPAASPGMHRAAHAHDRRPPHRGERQHARPHGDRPSPRAGSHPHTSSPAPVAYDPHHNAQARRTRSMAEHGRHGEMPSSGWSDPRAIAPPPQSTHRKGPAGKNAARFQSEPSADHTKSRPQHAPPPKPQGDKHQQSRPSQQQGHRGQQQSRRGASKPGHGSGGHGNGQQDGGGANGGKSDRHVGKGAGSVQVRKPLYGSHARRTGR